MTPGVTSGSHTRILASSPPLTTPTADTQRRTDTGPSCAFRTREMLRLLNTRSLPLAVPTTAPSVEFAGCAQIAVQVWTPARPNNAFCFTVKLFTSLGSQKYKCLDPPVAKRSLDSHLIHTRDKRDSLRTTATTGRRRFISYVRARQNLVSVGHPGEQQLHGTCAHEQLQGMNTDTSDASGTTTNDRSPPHRSSTDCTQQRSGHHQHQPKPVWCRLVRRTNE
jgi:hypothetical protein